MKVTHVFKALEISSRRMGAWQRDLGANLRELSMAKSGTVRVTY